MIPVVVGSSPISHPTLSNLQRAVEAFERGDTAQAERLCRSVLAQQPEAFEALYLAGIIAGSCGRPGEAVQLLARAARLRPIPDVHFNLGVAYGEMQAHGDALACYERVIAAAPRHEAAHFNRGATLAALGRHAEALESYERVIALDPGSSKAHHNLAVELAQLGRRSEALAAFDEAIRLEPLFANAHKNRGVTLAALDRVDEALQSYELAADLQPDFAEAHNHCAMALLDLDRPDEALARADRAVALQPGYADAWYIRGNALRELRRYRDAVAAYERALRVDATHVSAHWNLADCLLLLGEFERGWDEYSYRWKLPRPGSPARDPGTPLWDGTQPILGRTILLHGELGHGDTLQFCRYAMLVAERGARVILEVQPALVSLLATLPGVAEVIARGDALPAFDYHCPLMSLPWVYRTAGTDVPAPIPYLHGDPARVRAWRARLGASDRPTIGLVWSGSRGLRNDKRSMTLGQALPLLQTPARWVSLQKDVPEADAPLLGSRADLLHLGGDLADFAETAALVETLDLLVTVDTSIAHVGGALGKPVWIMLPLGQHDWRWGLEGHATPWYPTARLFRQAAPGDWGAVIDEVGRALVERVPG